MTPAVEALPVAAEVVKIVSFTSSGASESVNGTRSIEFTAPVARTMYNESSLRLSSTSSPAGSIVIESGSPIVSAVSAAFVTTFHTVVGAPASVEVTAVLVFFGLPEISTITGEVVLTCEEATMNTSFDFGPENTRSSSPPVMRVGAKE
jgi:hypothetical protein